MKPVKRKIRTLNTTQDNDTEGNVFEYPDEGSPNINKKKNMRNMTISGTGRARKHKARIDSLTVISTPSNNNSVPCFDYLIKTRKFSNYYLSKQL